MNVLILEDLPIFREALIDILGKRVDPVAAQCVTTAAEALEALCREQPQLIFADLSLVPAAGHQALDGLVEAGRGAIIAALDARPSATQVRRAQLAGAKAYIPMTSTRELIDAALGLLLAGGSYFPELPSSARPQDRASAQPRLSPRQGEVLELLHKGFSNSEIAEALGISVATVKLHVHAILKATGARNRTSLVVRNVRSAGGPIS